MSADYEYMTQLHAIVQCMTSQWIIQRQVAIFSTELRAQAADTCQGSEILETPLSHLELL